MAAKFDPAEFVKEINPVASHLGADITRCSRKKEILDVVVSQLGLEVGNEDRDDTRTYRMIQGQVLVQVLVG